ncbi:hypothetical protein MTO96_037320 [Rhipicephalus appendiculatus]
MLTTRSPRTASGLAITPPGTSGVAEASTNAHLRPPVPHTPWYRVVNARRRKVVAEEASTTPPAPFHQREPRHGTGRPRLPRLPAEDHKVVFRIRGGISLLQEVVLPLRAAIQTALRAPLPVEARIRVRKGAEHRPDQHYGPRPRRTAVPRADARARQQIV